MVMAPAALGGGLPGRAVGGRKNTCFLRGMLPREVCRQRRPRTVGSAAAFCLASSSPRPLAAPYPPLHCLLRPLRPLAATTAATATAATRRPLSASHLRARNGPCFGLPGTRPSLLPRVADQAGRRACQPICPSAPQRAYLVPTTVAWSLEPAQCEVPVTLLSAVQGVPASPPFGQIISRGGRQGARLLALSHFFTFAQGKRRMHRSLPEAESQ